MTAAPESAAPRRIAPCYAYVILSLSGRGVRPGRERGEKRTVKRIMMAAAGVAVLAATPALARESAWMGLGLRPISAATTSQTVEIGGVNVPREAMFCSDDSPVQIVSADFRYRNGETETVEVRGRIRAGDCSRVIRLRNRTQELASVSFTADPASLTTGATAQVRVLVR